MWHIVYMIKNKTIEFQNATMLVVAKFQDDSSVVKSERLRFTADLNQKLDHDFLMSHADKVFKWWEILDVELINSFVDSTEII